MTVEFEPELPPQFATPPESIATPEEYGADHRNAAPWRDELAINAAALAMHARGGGTVRCSGHYYVRSVNLTRLRSVTLELDDGAVIEQTFGDVKFPIVDMTGALNCTLQGGEIRAQAFTRVGILLARDDPASPGAVGSCNGNSIRNVRTNSPFVWCAVLGYGCEDTFIDARCYLINQNGGPDSLGVLVFGNRNPTEGYAGGGVTSLYVPIATGNRSTIANQVAACKLVIGVHPASKPGCLRVYGTVGITVTRTHMYSADNVTLANCVVFDGFDAQSSKVNLLGCLFEAAGDVIWFKSYGPIDARANTVYEGISIRNCWKTNGTGKWLNVEDTSVVLASSTFDDNLGPGDIVLGIVSQCLIAAHAIEPSPTAASVVTAQAAPGTTFILRPNSLTVADQTGNYTLIEIDTDPRVQGDSSQRGVYRQTFGGNATTQLRLEQATVDLTSFQVASGILRHVDGATLHPGGPQTADSYPYFTTESGQKVPLSVVTATPASETDAGQTGTIAQDSDCLYVCDAPNHWRRGSIGSWDGGAPENLTPEWLAAKIADIMAATNIQFVHIGEHRRTVGGKVRGIVADRGNDLGSSGWALPSNDAVLIAKRRGYLVGGAAGISYGMVAGTALPPLSIWVIAAIQLPITVSYGTLARGWPQVHDSTWLVVNGVLPEILNLYGTKYVDGSPSILIPDAGLHVYQSDNAGNLDTGISLGGLPASGLAGLPGRYMGAFGFSAIPTTAQRAALYAATRLFWTELP
jgi:hypothetical protein